MSILVLLGPFTSHFVVPLSHSSSPPDPPAPCNTDDPLSRPHMNRLYGDRLRKDGGLTKTLKSVAGKTLATKAGKHGPEIQRVVQEVRGSIEKVEERVSGALEDFLDNGGSLVLTPKVTKGLMI